MKGKKVLVTGAAGFIGTHLVKALLSEECCVTILVKQESDLSRLSSYVEQLDIVTLDLSSLTAESLKAQLKSVDLIFHLAAAGVNQSDQNDELTMKANVEGTRQLLEYAVDIGVERFVYCGSCFEYGSGSQIEEDQELLPQNNYAVSKVEAGKLVQWYFQNKQLPTAYLRLFMTYGPGEGIHRLVPYVIVNAVQGKALKLTKGEQTRDLVFVKDVVEAILLAGKKEAAIGEVINIASGKEYTVKTVVESILSIMHSKVKPEFGVIPYRENELWRLSGVCLKAKQLLGWEAKTSLQNGLEQTIQWFRSHTQVSKV